LLATRADWRDSPLPTAPDHQAGEATWSLRGRRFYVDAWGLDFDTFPAASIDMNSWRINLDSRATLCFAGWLTITTECKDAHYGRYSEGFHFDSPENGGPLNKS
jgi:hypothetical protein